MVQLDGPDLSKPTRLRVLASQLLEFAGAASIAGYATQMLAAADELERRASFLARGDASAVQPELG
jgi:hypothetical protein